MGLYDNYRQANSQKVSQFVGSIVPEIARAGQEARASYEQAQDMDDRLTEAMGNLQHLKTDEDSQYANELKQKYAARLQERSGRADYENLGRRTRRDAMQFTSEYQPLVQRQQAMSALMKKVQEDKDIFDPEEKARIIQWQQHVNGAKKDASGNFVRDASGKIVLGTIQEMPYAKDVNAVEKLDKYLSTVEAQVSQGGYRAEGGQLISDISKVRDPKVLAQLASQFFKNDPEMKAMMDRKVMLATYKMTPAEMKEASLKNNKSVYQQMKDLKMSDAQIKAQAILRGQSVEEMKVSELDKLKSAAKASGQSEDAAYAAYYKGLAYQSMVQPTIAMVAEKLKIDIHTIDARTDPDYAAKANAKAQAELDKAPNLVMVDTANEFVENNSTKPVDPATIKGLQDNINTTRAHIVASVASAMGVAPTSAGFSKQQRDQFEAIGKSKSSAMKAIKTLMAQGKTDQAAALEKNIETMNALDGRLKLALDQNQRRTYGAKSRAVGYTMLTDQNPNGAIGAYEKEVSNQLNLGGVDAIDMDTGKPVGSLINDKYGDVNARMADKKMQDMSIKFTASSAAGKPIAIATMPDGSRRRLIMNGVPASVFTDAHVAVLRNTGARNSNDLTSYQAKISAMALGEQFVPDVSRAELSTWSPSTVAHPIGNGYGVKVGLQGGQKTYRLVADGKPVGKPYTDPNQVFIDLGWLNYSKNTQGK